MRPAYEANVTTAPMAQPRAAGIWTLADGGPIIAEGEGTATILVPSAQVRLLAVDLPLPSHAKRLAALPFAIEEHIAGPVEGVHIALGAELAPRRYLVGVVAHEIMAAWVAQAESAGLGAAAMVPDALTLDRPLDGTWAVDLSAERAVVRVGDGSGFAVAPAMLLPAWQAAGRPAVTSYGAPLPEEMAAGQGVRPSGQLLAPALDLRQGTYARRHASNPNFWRRLGWIVAAGVAAHIVIAAADTIMLRSIADRRQADTRALIAERAPNAVIGEDLAGSVADLLPQGGASTPVTFLPLLNRVSAALAPLAGSFSVRAVNFEANVLTMDVSAADAGLAPRIAAALQAGGVQGTATAAPGGAVRITANGI